MSSFAVGIDPASTGPAGMKHRFFTRQRRNKPNSEHIGRSTAVQTFFEGPNFNESDENWVEHAPPSLPQAKKKKQEGAAVQVFKRKKRNWGHEGFYIYKVRLQSPLLRSALEETLKTYGVTYNKNDLFADSYEPHRALFFSIDKIAEVAKTTDDETTRSHSELLLSVIEEIFDEDFDDLEVLDRDDTITFKLLWTLFPEKSIYADAMDGLPPRGFRVKKVNHTFDSLQLQSETIVFDGFRYSTTQWTDDVARFEGAVSRNAIPGLAYPGLAYLNLDKNPDLRARLIERGRKALDMQTIRYMKVPVDPGTSSMWLKGKDQQRVIVDTYLFVEREEPFKDLEALPGYDIKNGVKGRAYTGGKPTSTPKHDRHAGEDKEVLEVELRSIDGAGQKDVVSHPVSSRWRDDGSSGTDREAPRRPTEAEIQVNRRIILDSEENLFIMNHLAYGYSLDHRKWQTFDIDRLTPVESDKSIFQKVVLDEQKKDVLKTLVESHMESTARYDDLIVGKGQCLVIILSGPPGTGKTLVAESLSEHMGCPLLRVDPNTIQPDTFLIIMKDAAEWGSLVLFDEPDFLFENQESSTDRKNLLAFLRQAEYFKGIIFLTTNLGRSIDPAVLSRAQIHITFPDLNEPNRVRVWQNFIDRVPEDVGSLSAEDVARLATWRINGREIKNILNMAVSWYRKKGEFSVGSIETLIKTICPSARREEHAVGNGSTGDGEEVDLLGL
ncbi:P-loop containing nucleoside triphosphate hydrolase protein [Echria macrotheca]|uniref:P-loop containing nucleoside triphosphate hydrolase protein n=1 Tax=Echria macrotheca TaxID=438768 RepID=A0AAJ0FB48_9PEZI|nr:P-loop containing nucleoside triphosphate hydrolase protein [Echria macrotheca]